MPVKKCASWNTAQNGLKSVDIDNSIAVSMALSTRMTTLRSAAVVRSFDFTPQARDAVQTLLHLIALI